MMSLRKSYRLLALSSGAVFLAVGLLALLSLQRWTQSERRSALARDLVYNTVTLSMLISEDSPGLAIRAQWAAASAKMRRDLLSFGEGIPAPREALASISQAERLLAWGDELFRLMAEATGHASQAVYRSSLSTVTLHLGSRIRLMNSAWAVEARKSAIVSASIGFIGSNLVLMLFIVFAGARMRSRMLRPLQRLAEDIGSYAGGDVGIRAAMPGVPELDVVAASFNRAADESAALTGSLNLEIAERARAQDSLARRLKEKDTLLRETHHRIKNNLASVAGLLELQALGIEDSQAAASLREAELRVAGMRNLYERMLLSDRYGEIPADPYVADIAGMAIEAAKGSCGVRLVSSGDDLSLSVKTLFPLGIALNELVTNAVKYGFEGRSEGLVEVGLRSLEGVFILSVGDDGVGLPPGFDPSAGAGFGLSLVSMLAEQLGGSFSIGPRREGSGTAAVLSFRIREASPAAAG